MVETSSKSVPKASEAAHQPSDDKPMPKAVDPTTTTAKPGPGDRPQPAPNKPAPPPVDKSHDDAEHDAKQHPQAKKPKVPPVEDRLATLEKAAGVRHDEGAEHDGDED